MLVGYYLSRGYVDGIKVGGVEVVDLYVGNRFVVVGSEYGGVCDVVFGFVNWIDIVEYYIVDFFGV